MSVNPFDYNKGGFCVLVNDDGRHRLWPAFVVVPAGWRVVHREAADRVDGLDGIEQNWADIRPKTLRERLAAGRVSKT